MKIVIAGAGDVGFHLAKLLSHEQQDIVLIDSNQEVLDYALTKLDVITIKGDCSSVEILNRAEIKNVNLFLAVTTHESSNIVACILAKKLGAKQVIARVRNQEYLTLDQKNTFRELGIDKLISPTLLAAQEIERLVEASQLTDNFAFEGGILNVVGVSMEDDSPFNGMTLREINSAYPNIQSRAIAILRKDQTILPKSNTRLQKNDHVYFIAKKETIPLILTILKKQIKRIKNIMIVGAEEISLQTALRLENKYRLKIVDNNKSKCKRLVENLNNTLVIKGDPSNIELLKEEGLEEMDAFIALLPNSETNIISSLMAEEYGVFKTIALVDNTDYTHISQNIGIDTLINKKLIAANNIFRYVRKGKIEAITSLHGVDAEIIEFVVQKNNKLTRKPLRDLHFPEDAVIGGVIRNEESLLPNGDFVLNMDDKVIIFAMSKCISKLEEMFR